MTRQEKEALRKYLGQEVKVIYIEGHMKSKIGVITETDRDYISVNGKQISFLNYWRMIYKIFLLPAQELIFVNDKIDFSYGSLSKEVIEKLKEIRRAQQT